MADRPLTRRELREQAAAEAARPEATDRAQPVVPEPRRARRGQPSSEPVPAEVAPGVGETEEIAPQPSAARVDPDQEPAADADAAPVLDDDVDDAAGAAEQQAPAAVASASDDDAGDEPPETDSGAPAATPPYRRGRGGAQPVPEEASSPLRSSTREEPARPHPLAWLTSWRQQLDHAPAWVWIAIIYLSARIVTTIFFAIAAASSTASSRYGADATIGTLSMGWDSQWYWVVATSGYPSELPVTDSGNVAQNAWAFLPVYPFLARALSFPFGGHYPVGAIVLSLLAGFACCLVLYHLLRTRLTHTAALWSIVFFANGPLAALFQIGYAEVLGLVWLLLALWCLIERRFVWLYLLIPLMGYTRPGVLAFALMLASYGVWRWFRRGKDPLPVRDIVHIVGLGLLGAVVGLSWQWIAAAVTGSPSAYLDTELAWRRDWLGADHEFAPVAGFVDGAMLWFRVWHLPEWLGVVALALLVIGAAYVLLFSRRVAALGVEQRLWAGSYIVYLLLVFFPQSSIFRLLFPLAPLVGVLGNVRRTPVRIGFLVACLALQFVWIFVMFARGETYWQIP